MPTRILNIAMNEKRNHAGALLFLWGAVLAAFVAFAALAGAAEGSPLGPGRTQDAAGRIAQYYENIAQRTLSRYYEEATFLVKARVDAEAPVEAEPPAEELGAAGSETPPQLPGLPFLPETMQPTPSEKDAKPNAQGNPSVTLDVLVDTSYSDRDLEFVRNLLTMAAHLDETRGDKVSVHEGVFPRDNRALQSYRKPMEPPPLAAAKNDSTARAGSDRDKDRDRDKDKDKEKPVNPFSAYMDYLPSLIPLVLICLLILACVWMVSRAISGSSHAERLEQARAYLHAQPESTPTSQPVDTKVGAASAKPQPSEMSGFRPFLLNCFVGSPKHCGQIIKSWIQRDPEKGLRDAAALVASLDGRLMGVLAPEIGRELAQQMETHLSVGEPQSQEELLVTYKEFKREFQNLQGGDDNDQYKDLFGFLRQMNEQQIMHILRDESQGIAGLVMAQLPGETSGAILQKIDPENRAKLLIAMGNIDHIPLNVYKEIADRLSLKALEVGNMRYVAADGVDSILELIDSLPLSLQFQYIHSISEMDLGLGEKLRNRYVTLPELVGLPDRFLSGILQNLDQETLIMALLHVDEAIRGKVLSLLPERMQMMVSSGLEGGKDATPKDSETAQRRLLHRIRDEIKHSGRPA